MRSIEAGGESWTAIAAVTGCTLSRDVVQDAARIHFQETIPGRHLDDEHVPRPIEIHAKWLQQAGPGGRYAGAILCAARDEHDSFRP